MVWKTSPPPSSSPRGDANGVVQRRGARPRTPSPPPVGSASCSRSNGGGMGDRWARPCPSPLPMRDGDVSDQGQVPQGPDVAAGRTNETPRADAPARGRLTPAAMRGPGVAPFSQVFGSERWVGIIVGAPGRCSDWCARRAGPVAAQRTLASPSRFALPPFSERGKRRRGEEQPRKQWERVPPLSSSCSPPSSSSFLRGLLTPCRRPRRPPRPCRPSRPPPSRPRP
jgi:hypothetical protein